MLLTCLDMILSAKKCRLVKKNNNQNILGLKFECIPISLKKSFSFQED